MKKNLLKILTILVLFTTYNLLHTTYSLAQDKGVQLSPAFIQMEANKGEVISDEIEIKYINFTNADIEVVYKEFDAEYKFPEESALLKSSSKVKLISGEGKTDIDFSINTSNMEDKTYFFGYEVRFNNIKSNSTLSEKIAVTVPIILTVNSSEEVSNPKPQIIIEKTSDLYFDQGDILIKAKIANISPKIINFSGELVFATEKNEIFYTHKISGKDNKLFPNQIISGQVFPDFSQFNKDALPFTGKIKVFYRGVVNNERHVQSNTLEFYLVPLKVIYILFAIFAILIISALLISLRKRSNIKGQSSKIKL